MLAKRRLWLAAVLTAFILGAKLSPVAPLVDAATGNAFSGGHLELPWLHVLLTPFSSFADALDANSSRQDVAMLAFLLALYGPFRFFILGHERARWREAPLVLTSLGLYFGLVAMVLACAVLAPRPAARLALDDPDLLAVDFHSHTAASWDGRKSFTPSANAAWHTRLGYGAAFVTDHNTTAGSTQGSMESRRRWDSGEREQSASLEGEEVSLDGAHVLLLGSSKFADPKAFEGAEGLRRFLGEAGPSFGGLAVLSLPEYWKYHWNELEALAEAGAKGVELVTASPKAMEFPDAGRRQVVDLCRRLNLFLASGSDNHGWASAGVAWSVVRARGWRSLSPLERQKAVMGILSQEGYGAVRIAARARVDPSQGDWDIFLDAPRSWWLQARGWTGAQALAALAWLWALPFTAWLRHRERF